MRTGRKVVASVGPSGLPRLAIEYYIVRDRLLFYLGQDLGHIAIRHIYNFFLR